MHNYVYLKEKEFFRPSKIITYNIPLFDLIHDSHQKLLPIIRCLLLGIGCIPFDARLLQLLIIGLSHPSNNAKILRPKYQV